jgi:EpsI family protein
MLMSLVVPVVANWLRAYMIVMLAHLSGNRIATGVDHVLYGWVFFGIIIFIMFVIGARWSEPDQALVQPTQAARAAAALSYSASPLLVTALLGAIVVALPHAALGVLKRAEGAASEARLELPPRLAGAWTTDGARLVEWLPIFANPSTMAFKAYAGPGGTVGAHVAYYRGQGGDRKLVSSQNVLLGMRDRDWNVLEEGAREIQAGGQSVAVRTAELVGQPRTDGRRSHLVVWRFYWVDGRFIRGDVATKLAGGLARLKGRGDEGAALVLYADEETVAASNAALQAFVQANIGELNKLLQQTRDGR